VVRLGSRRRDMNQENELVSLNVAGSISFASGFPRTFTQNSYALIDDSRRFGANIHFKPAGHLLVCKTILQLLVWLGGAKAPLGLVVSAAVRATLPVKPPVGVTVIVEVLPVVAPGATLPVASSPCPPKSQRLPLVSVQVASDHREPGKFPAPGFPKTW
jgi:hypothetical protein